jgi:RNA polymerase sigma factor (sigma-70 family)
MQTDKEIIEGILSGSEQIIYNFFFVDCKRAFACHRHSIFDDGVEINAMISEFYIHLQENNWERLRTFDARYSLSSWVYIVARNCFINNKKRLEQQITPEGITESKRDALIEAQRRDEEDSLTADLMDLVNLMTDKTCRYVLLEHCIKGREPIDVAEEMGVTLTNFYVIKLRAVAKFKRIVEKYW